MSEIESVSLEAASECKEIIPKEKIPHKKQGWKKPELVYVCIFKSANLESVYNHS